MQYFFVGKNIMVCLSTTKTMKILPPPNTRYTVYCQLLHVHCLNHRIVLLELSYNFACYVSEIGVHLAQTVH